jgi:hypothetical protein
VTRIVEAIRDPELGARIVSSRELRYAAGPDRALDRPGHVRAASDLAWIGERLVVLQDDANFLAVLEPSTGQVDAVTLPPGEGGKRQFDSLRGTKDYKLDLESSAVVPASGGPLLLAFGSGSGATGRRDRIVLVDGWDDPLHVRVRVRHADRLYALLRERVDFSGSELNVEGAMFDRGVVRLLQRGNGASHGALQPVDATGDLAWESLAPYLLGQTDDPPALDNVVQYDLGEIHGCRLTFTSGAVGPQGSFYATSAEDSPDAVLDGPVAGSALGIFSADGAPRWTLLCDADGTPALVKIEGLALDPQTEGRAYLVADPDDPTVPATLHEVRLSGPWRRR